MGKDKYNLHLQLYPGQGHSEADFIPGSLGVRGEYTLYGRPAHLRVPCATHSHTNSHLRAIWSDKLTYWDVFGRWEKTRKPGEISFGHEEKM